MFELNNWKYSKSYTYQMFWMPIKEFDTNNCLKILISDNLYLQTSNKYINSLEKEHSYNYDFCINVWNKYGS